MTQLNLDTSSFTDTVDLKAIEELAKFVVLEEAKIEAVEYEIKQRIKKVETAKSDISRMLHEAGMESAQLSCCLTPKRKVKRVFYAVGGINADPVFDWLKTRRINRNVLAQILSAHSGTDISQADCEIGSCWPDSEVISENEAIEQFPDVADDIRDKSSSLEDIIDTSPRVHFQTLQSALAEFEGLGGPVPEDLFKISETETITMYNKKKFLEAQKNGL